MKHRLFGGAPILLSAAVVQFLVNLTALAQGRGPTRVEVLPVVEKQVAPTISLVGTIRPSRRAVIATEVAGLVAGLPVDEGESVSEGQVLCRLRETPRRLSHEEARARLSELLSFLAVQQAELAKAKFEKERTEELSELGRSTQKELTDAVADFEAAEARVQQARHALESQHAVVERFADDLARTQIKAPFDGVIAMKQTELGEWVEQGGGIVELLDLAVVRVRVNLPEAYVAFNDIGAEAHVHVEALNRNVACTVSRLIPDADERARTFPLDIDVPNADGSLKAGMFVRALVPAGPKAKHLLVPKDAVLTRGPMRILFTVHESERGQMADLLPVEVDFEVLDHVAVRAAGLSDGDMVVVRGNESMMGPGPVIARLHAKTPPDKNRHEGPDGTDPVAGGKRQEASASDG